MSKCQFVNCHDPYGEVWGDEAYGYLPETTVWRRNSAMTEITSRERTLLAFNRKMPDRVPLDLGSKGSSIALSAYEDLKTYLGIETPTSILDKRLGIAVIDEEVLERFHTDTRYIYMKAPAHWELRPDRVNDTWVDEWGATLKRPQGGYYYDHVEYPIKEADLGALKKYNFVDPDDRGRYAGLREEAKKYYDKGYAVGTYLKGVAETIWILRGMQNAFIDMGLNKSFYHALADKTSEILARMVENLIAEVGEYLQFICVTCDLGTQNNQMISIDTYKTFVRPYEKRIFDVVKKNSEAKAAQHSCGAIFDLIPYIIESGVEIINPVQTNARGMDTALLKKEYGAEVCFWGGVDIQKIVPFGTPNEVKREVKRVINDLGENGGYLLGPSHDIQANTPPQNVIAVYEAAWEYGTLV